MHRTHKRRSAASLQPVRERVAALFTQAQSLFIQGKTELARRRVRQARKTAMKVQLRIPQHAQQYCRRCESYLKPGVNVTIRIKNGMRICTCKECGAVRRTKMK